MKQIFLLSFYLLAVLSSHAQNNNNNKPPYLQYPTIPAFTIYKAQDSSAFTRQQLKKRPVIFIVFDPGCDHCQRETDSLLAHINRFKKIQVVMVTYLPHEEMVDFYHDYKISRYPEITMGSDPKYFFPSYFRTRSLPGIFVYDKNHLIKKSFEGTVSIDKILSALQ